jgi:Flp pilus assembly pilin Flp
MKKKLMSGFTTVEYTLICTMVFLGFFTGNPSIAQRLANALKSFYRALTFFISLP